MKRPPLRFVVPLAIFVILAVCLGFGLDRDPHEIPSPLIGKAAPDFALPELHDATRVFSPERMKGQVWMLNVWASWCGACQEEHPLLVDLARSGQVAIYGLDYKDERAAALAWLQRRGDPYRVSILDAAGTAGIDFGVYGVPETFVIDGAGVIRYKHIGALTRRALDEKILPLMRDLASRSGG